MPTEIQQVEDTERGRIILRVRGAMELPDALLLERIATDVRAEHGKPIVFDFSDLNFLDSDSASILKGMENTYGFSIEGIENFLQSAIDESERR